VEYQVVVLPSAEADLEQLSSEVRRAIIRRVEWLRVNAETVIHHRLQNLPTDLSGLCRLRYSDYRILYWHYPAKRTIKVYRIQHRSEVYRDL
jgi:mRNA-degrading endonuclease RelE of RelBE toxin-antitoxin system